MKKTPGVLRSPRLRSLRMMRRRRRWRSPQRSRPASATSCSASSRRQWEAGNAADVLADVLPEFTSEVSGIESAFGDIQAANVGLKDQADTLKDQYLRLNADFDNFKKRTLKEKEQLSQTAKSKFFEALLPALDNFDLAQANLKPEDEEAQKVVSQYQGLVDGLMTILTSQGLSTVDGVGAPFDPNFHEAIMREESADAAEDTILEEFRKGYKLGENTLIRPAMVKVSAAPSSE
tara:strand:+ start:507 stop:1208 length:702 start_codon:yes stop_codon:yes gene_type:complete